MSSAKERRRQKTNADTAKIDEYVGEIRTIWKDTVAGIIRTGTILIEAKKALGPRGKWGEMAGKLPFSERTAQMLMAIARHPVLSNPKYFADLPACWSTLYTLSLITPRELENAMQLHAVHSGITQVEVRRLPYYRLELLPKMVEQLIDLIRDYPDPEHFRESIDTNWQIPQLQLPTLENASEWFGKLYAICVEVRNDRESEVEAKIAETQSMRKKGDGAAAHDGADEQIHA